MGKANVGIVGENGQRLPSGVAEDPIFVSGTSGEAENTSEIPAIFEEGSVTVETAGTPVPVTEEEFLVQSVEFQAQLGRTVNSSNVFIGIDGDANRIITPGNTFSLEAPPGQKLNLGLLFVDSVVSGEGVEWLAIR